AGKPGRRCPLAPRGSLLNNRLVLSRSSTRSRRHWSPRIPAWRRDALRASLWLVPTVQIAVAVAAFAVTYAIDRRAYDGEMTLPSWVNSGGADAARQILVG